MKGEHKMKSVKAKNGFSTSVLVKAALLAAVSIILTRFFSYMIPIGGLPALRIGFGNIPLIIAGMMLGPVVGGVVGVISDLVGFMINPMGGMFFPGFTLTAALYGIISGVLFQNLKIHKSKMNFNYINAILMVLFAGGILMLMMTTDVIVFSEGALRFNDTSALPILILMALVTALFVILPFAISSRFKHLEQKIKFDKIAFTVSITYVFNALFLNTLWLSMMLDKGFIVLLPGRIVASVVTIPIYSWIIYTLSKVINLTEEN